LLVRDYKGHCSYCIATLKADLHSARNNSSCIKSGCCRLVQTRRSDCGTQQLGKHGLVRTGAVINSHKHRSNASQTISYRNTCDKLSRGRYAIEIEEDKPVLQIEFPFTLSDIFAHGCRYIPIWIVITPPILVRFKTPRIPNIAPRYFPSLERQDLF
jgi:hypothetical protein